MAQFTLRKLHPCSLCMLSCPCYLNLSVTMPCKLSSHSTPCLLLSYPSSHKGYRCLDMSIRHIIITLHVDIDESMFPFTSAPSVAFVLSSLHFLCRDLPNNGSSLSGLCAPQLLPPLARSSSQAFRIQRSSTLSLVPTSWVVVA